MSHLKDKEIFERISQLKVVVIGDLMLDQYIMGRVDRISPEAPVPVLLVEKKDARLGGAANVALNCRSLGAQVTVASVIGKDASGLALKGMLEENGINTELLFLSANRITTTKSRIISRTQQMIRLDEETTEPIATEDEHPFIDATLRYLQIHKPDLVIFEDYNKGVLKPNVIERVLAHCKHVGIITAVDPKFEHFLEYRNVDIFKPNLKEVQKGLGLKIDTVDMDHLQSVHQKLSEALQNEVTLLTLSEHGMYYSNGTEQQLIPSEVRQLADVSGAGDTVISVAAMVYAITKDIDTMAHWSNVAGGLVCEELGVVPVEKEKLAQNLNNKHS